ncbi:MAG: endonuclease/exonuclease/phosphatase family protein [Rhodobacteraceae bacterium]|nr:endonuclease/exonuclease/phosphatase family protein [Paracoccaceae bacterium]
MIRLALTIAAFALALPVFAEPFRVATYNVALSRKGPGVLLHDIVKGNDPQISAVANILRQTRPDILLINEFDHDYENRALRAFLDVLAEDDGNLAGLHYPYYFAPPQNTGVQSGLDLDGDGRIGDASDAFGFGHFRGQYAMALVSRFPINTDGAKDYSQFLARDLRNADLPVHDDGSPFPSAKAQSVQRLSSKGHWDVPITLPDGKVIHILASHPTPPVFDGPEDQNGKRNGEEIRFWTEYLDGRIEAQSAPPPQHGFAIMGDLNADPSDGEGNHQANKQLLNDERLQDPKPRSRGAVLASESQGKANTSHLGDPALDTADWRDDPEPGNLRVDYVRPSKSLKVLDSGVFWPTPDAPLFDLIGLDGNASSDHRLVWVDLE